MPEEGIVTTGVGADSPPAKGSILDTPEAKAVMEAWRAEQKKGLDAELARKKVELEEQTRRNAQPAPGSGPAADFFKSYEERYGVPAEGVKELLGVAVGFVQEQLKPLQSAGRKQELRSQRTELRSANPRLAKLDDQYHGEVMTLLEPLTAVDPDSYARALQMVIGQHYAANELTDGSGTTEGGSKEREIVTGPQPRGGGEPPKPKAKLTSHQESKAEDMGITTDSYVEIMRDRARRLIASGKTKEQVRAQLGKDLEGIEF